MTSIVPGGDECARSKRIGFYYDKREKSAGRVKDREAISTDEEIIVLAVCLAAQLALAKYVEPGDVNFPSDPQEIMTYRRPQRSHCPISS